MAPRAVVIIRDPAARALIADTLTDAGCEVQQYERPRDWPFMGQIMSGRCFRVGQCGAEALVVDNEPDPLFTGAELVLHQARQGCRCTQDGRCQAKLVLADGPIAERLRGAGATVMPSLDWSLRAGEMDSIQFTAALQEWARLHIRESWTAPVEAVTPTLDKVLFMRCPYTGTVVPADSLKRLQDHFEGLGHRLVPRQVMRLREANWCDAAGNPVTVPEGDLERLRVTTE